MRGIPVANKVPAALEYLQRANLVAKPAPPDTAALLAHVLTAAGDRVKTMGDILMFREFFVADDALPTAGAEFDKALKAAGARELLVDFAAQLAAAPSFEPAALEEALKAFVAARGIKIGQVIHPLRYALTGRTVGLGLYDALAILGRERSLARIDRALAQAAA
jgi:glutamyl-tRNA synthetase